MVSRIPILYKLFPSISIGPIDRLLMDITTPGQKSYSKLSRAPELSLTNRCSLGSYLRQSSFCGEGFLSLLQWMELVYSESCKRFIQKSIKISKYWSVRYLSLLLAKILLNCDFDLKQKQTKSKTNCIT